MESCRNIVVCKYKHTTVVDHEETCLLVKVCKYNVEPTVDVPAAPLTPTGRTKRKYNTKKKLVKFNTTRQKDKPGAYKGGNKRGNYSFLTTSDKDIRRARQILKFRQVAGTLTDNQIAALNVFKNVKPKKLAEHQRRQILDILKTSSEQKKSKEDQL